jgi:hypothetical protein
MGLDIIRFIEVKQDDGKWKRLCMEGAMNHFNNGKSICEYWLDKTEIFHSGLPQDFDQTSEEVYKDWGFNPKYITIPELENALSNYEHLLHLKLKNSLLIQEIKQSIHGDVNGDYYAEYPYNDYEIEDKFDDTFAIGMLKLSALRDDLISARNIVDFVYDEKYVPSNNVRIIYIYNR